MTRIRRTKAFDIAVCWHIRNEQCNLAEGIRRHGVAFAQATTATQYEQVCESLRGGLLAAVAGDHEFIFANSDDPLKPAVIKRMARITAVPLLLIGLAVVVAWLPEIDQQSVASVRVLLVVAAIFSMIPNASSELSGTVHSTLEKAMSGARR